MDEIQIIMQEMENQHEEDKNMLIYHNSKLKSAKNPTEKDFHQTGKEFRENRLEKLRTLLTSLNENNIDEIRKEFNLIIDRIA
jgi:hypothetical protein